LLILQKAKKKHLEASQFQYHQIESVCEST
jgi:hypothetical protein